MATEGTKKGNPYVKLLIAIPLIGLTGWGLYELATQPERDTKDVKVDYALAGYWWDTDAEAWRDDGEGWNPSSLANELKYTMDVTALPGYGITDRYLAWTDLGLRHDEGIKVLHNYWNDNIDPKDSLYEWIDGEVTYGGSPESEAQKFVLGRLTSAGLAPL